MASNCEISRLFNLYAELLLLHEKNERLAALLNGASNRIRNYEVDIASLNKKQLTESYRPEIVKLITELSAAGTIEDLDELLQLTPQGLFEMMRIKDLGGKNFRRFGRKLKLTA